MMQHIQDDAWNAWTPELLFDRLRHLSSPWYVVGGWALDLLHGYKTRDHEDLEFCVLSEDVDLYRTVLSELEFFQVLNGAPAHLAPETKPLPDVSQIWGADLDNQCWRVDMMIEQGTPNDWVYKRDPSFRLPRSVAVQQTAGGIPYLAPTLVLFFKAKHLRDKDMQDFSTALPKLDAQQKSDLGSWLRATYPGHQWISSLQ